ncbi:TlpA family protein disulfide reductase [Agromyces mediolanus]|uniref:Thiol-disulfide isomerase n=1 Tax=Agromyces mediolanus TaxID=41986 RepID=A0A918FD26_AGRME|nr:TlpA disulfide reductase family protein [Agromyces mediolanus]GGR28638.1 thiol-disulfide isomerase [Agromyces mediolanus]GLJ72103.1 thiol-disulfide isomerase [Agromyces mediolanus]
MKKLVAAAALAAASIVVLAGCSSDPLAEQYREGSGKNYIAGDGTISEFDEASRGEPVSFSGPTVDGGGFDSADIAGDVTVVNFWYAGCAPCRAEAPILQEVYEGYGSGADEVSFVGVNVRDQAGTASSFERDYGVHYPSILDVDSGDAQLAFAGDVPPAAVPTTLVLDREGRVAARVLGELQDASILRGLVDKLLEEQ